jgi:hypothetical protein
MAESGILPQSHVGWPKGKRRQGPTRSKRHGFHELKTVLERLGSRALDPDTEVGRALAAWREALIEDLGGEGRLSVQELALVELAVRDRVLLESVDAWLFSQPKLVNGKKQAVFPAVVERMKLAEGFTRRLQALGLARRAPPELSLAEYLEARSRGEAAEAEAEAEPEAGLDS